MRRPIDLQVICGPPSLLSPNSPTPLRGPRAASPEIAPVVSCMIAPIGESRPREYSWRVMNSKNQPTLRKCSTAALAVLVLGLSLPLALIRAQSSSYPSGSSSASSTSGSNSSNPPASGSSSSKDANWPSSAPSASTTPSGTGVYTSGSTTSAASNASPAATSREAKQQQRFLMRAYAANQREIQLAQLASTKATDPQVRSYAQDLVKQHQQLESDLKPLLASNGLDSSMLLSPTGRVTTPDGKSTGSLIDRWKAMMSDRKEKKLSEKTGKDFDKDFVNLMIDEHQDAIDLYQDAADDTTGQVQSFAIQSLTHLQEHLDQAERLDKSLK